MAFNLRLNVQSVFRRLGIQSGARLPQLNDNIQMTMLLTDLSRLVPAPIEPRGLCGANITSPVPRFATFQLQSLAGGGIFIESMFLRGQAPTITDNYIVDVSDDDLGLPVVSQINIGGTPVRSIATAGDVVVPTNGTSIPSPTAFDSFSFPLGIFVPNQQFFSIRHTNSAFRMDIALIYRELPSVEEAG